MVILEKKGQAGSGGAGWAPGAMSTLVKLNNLYVA